MLVNLATVMCVLRGKRYETLAGDNLRVVVGSGLGGCLLSGWCFCERYCDYHGGDIFVEFTVIGWDGILLSAENIDTFSNMILRHRNGRGLLLDDAEANRSTYIDKTSSASGFAKLRDCRLTDRSVAAESCQVYGGVYRGTHIKGNTICAGSPLVVESLLDCSEVSGHPSIYNARLMGVTEVCDWPTIGNATLDGAIVYGWPLILGEFTVTGRVHEGVWTRAPKHIKLPWCDLSECVDGKVLLDCRCRSAEYWLTHGPKLARRWDWSEDMIEVTIETIRREFYCQNVTERLECGRDTLSTVTT